ncbi:MAG: hypothetical protein F4208_08355 [Gemmatimonadales bacterium]|nr:hypothetical protein [Gemmatimonadales bacterium]
MGTSAERLTRSIRWLQGYAALMTVALVVLFVRGGAATDDVIRAQGLIIEDAAGRERILIGAPIPEASDRVRTDEARVREVWGPGFPEAYMDFYRDYNHETNGMLILNDRGVIGGSLPDRERTVGTSPADASPARRRGRAAGGP